MTWVNGLGWAVGAHHQKIAIVARWTLLLVRIDGGEDREHDGSDDRQVPAISWLKNSQGVAVLPPAVVTWPGVIKAQQLSWVVSKDQLSSEKTIWADGRQCPASIWLGNG